MAQTEFLQLFQPHSEDLHKFLTRKLGCAATAADLFQETWLRLLKMDPHRTVENPRALLFRIAINLVTDHYRQTVTHAQHFIDDGSASAVLDEAPSIEREVFSKQQYKALKAAVSALPPKRRTIFIMNKFEHKTYAEIATTLGITESTVMKQMVKALAFCKTRVESDE